MAKRDLLKFPDNLEGNIRALFRSDPPSGYDRQPEGATEAASEAGKKVTKR